MTDVLAIIIAFYVFVFLFDFLPLYHEKQRREIAVYSVLGLMSFAVAVLLSFGVRIPSPEAPIRQFIMSIFGK